MDFASAQKEGIPSSQFVVDDLDTNLHLANVPENALVIHNIGAHADFGVPLTYQDLLRCFSNAVYAPQDFNCLRIDVRVRSSLNASTRQEPSERFPNIEHVTVLESGRELIIPSLVSRRFENVPQRYIDTYASAGDYCNMKASLFNSGKVSITGGKSLLGICVALEKICRAIRRRINQAARLKTVIATNILAVYNYRSHIVLKNLEKCCKEAMYDPFRFAGVRIRFPVTSSPFIHDARSLIRAAFGKVAYRPPEIHEVEDPEYNYDSDRDTGEQEDNVHSEHLDPQKELPQSATTPFSERPVTHGPSIASNSNVPRSRNVKKHLHRFLNDIIPSNKRKIHQTIAMPAVQAKIPTKRARDSEDNRVWLKEQKQGGNQIGSSKEEVVTINVFATGNVTFTGARSIASIQKALSYLMPYLVQSTAGNVLN